MNANGLIAPPVSAISIPDRPSPIAPSIVSRSVSRIRPRSCWMTRSVIAAIARSTRIAPCCAGHRSVTATTVDAAKMNTHVATRITRYRASGRRSPGALDRAPRNAVIVVDRAPAGPVVGRRPARGAAQPLTQWPRRDDDQRKERDQRDPKQREQCVDRHVFPPRADGPRPRGRILPRSAESATEAHAASGACRHRVAADQRGPGTIGGARRHRGAGGHRLAIAPSAGPDGQRVPHW